MSLRQVHTDLLTILQSLSLDPGANAMAMVDFETNHTQAMGGKRRIFDFGYGFFNPVTGFKGDIQSNLVYEGFIDPKVAEQILGWDKIRYAAQDEYYGLFNQLKAKNWWDDRMMTEAQIRQNIEDNVIQDSLAEKYQEQTALLTRKIEILGTWMGPRFLVYKEAPRRIYERREDIETIQRTIAHLERWMKSGDNLKSLIESARLTNKPSHDEIMRDIYQKFYEEHAERYDPLTRSKDMQVIREIKKEMGHRFAAKLDTWANTILGFHDDMINNPNLVGITAYNLQHEQGAIKEMNEAFGIDSSVGDLTRDEYTLICMHNLTKLINNQELWSLFLGLDELSEGAVMEGLKGLAKKTLSPIPRGGRPKSVKGFELTYRHVFGTEDYKQPHTASGDVSDQMDVFAEFISEHFEDFLKARLNKKR